MSSLKASFSFWRVAIVVLILLSIFLTIVYKQTQFRIVSTDPAINQMTIWTPYFKLDLSKEISTNSVSVSTNPNIIYKNDIKTTGKTVTIYLSVPLDSSKTYTVSVNGITSANGQKIFNRQFSFKPRQVSRDSLPDEQKETLIQRNEQSSVYSDPLLKYLPYRSVDFALAGSFGATTNNQPQLSIQAQLLLHLAQSNDKDAAVATDKQEVIDYIKSLGLDPSKYNIQYSVISP